MVKWQYTKGLHDLGNGAYAYLQPDGSWGWSNAGLIVDGDQTLLVDTLFDLTCTAEMLAAMRAAVPAAQAIGTLVNTHSNGDHTFGNQLVREAEIIASAACAAEMAERPPAELAGIINNAAALGEGAQFFRDMMGPHKFNFDDIELVLPSRTFEDELTLQIGATEVRLFNVGPAHTRGDVLVYVPQLRTVFTGDILFIEGHPIMWDGPLANWIAAFDLMLAWDLETVVPGHGPITDKDGIRRLKAYFEYLDGEARARFEAGLSVADAATEIAMDAYAHWSDGERVVANVHALYREYGATDLSDDPFAVLALMARQRKFMDAGAAG